MGNVNRGDGRRYKGRGLLQLTGRGNYHRYGKLLGLELEENPTIAADPPISLTIACQYWADRKINPLCDNDDLPGVTRKINGGLNGLAMRRAFLIKAKATLARTEASVIGSAAKPGDKPTLRRGSQGEAVLPCRPSCGSSGFRWPSTETSVLLRKWPSCTCSRTRSSPPTGSSAGTPGRSSTRKPRLRPKPR